MAQKNTMRVIPVLVMVVVVMIRGRDDVMLLGILLVMMLCYG